MLPNNQSEVDALLEQACAIHAELTDADVAYVRDHTGKAAQALTLGIVNVINHLGLSPATSYTIFGSVVAAIAYGYKQGQADTVKLDAEVWK